jgi:hypothetical protein
LLREYGAELQYIQGDKNVVADMLSCLPTQELFTFEENANAEFPLNLALIADKQTIDDHLQNTVTKKPQKYSKNMIENIQLYMHHATETINIPAFLQAAILQCTTPLYITQEKSTCKPP